MYVSDTLNQRIRKVSNNLRFPTATGSSLVQTVDLHLQPGDTFNGTTLSSPDFTFTLGTCTTNPDTTSDCNYSAIFKPATAGVRAVPLKISTTNNSPGVFTLSRDRLGAGAILDPAARLVLGRISPPFQLRLTMLETFS